MNLESYPIETIAEPIKKKIIISHRNKLIVFAVILKLGKTISFV
jgi:hypothetical protein